MQPVARVRGKRFDDHGPFQGDRRCETLSMFVFETSTRRWAAAEWITLSLKGSRVAERTTRQRTNCAQIHTEY